jgi:N-sulfoglucosamine sulfohydrolase
MFLNRAFLTGISCALAFTCFAQAADERPNILWITAEDMSPKLGCYGDAQAVSPNLDALAAAGRRFTRVFVTAPVCAPSRSALITGQYATSIGTHHMRSKGVPPVGTKCFTEDLRAAGYYCTNNVKTDYNFPPPLTAWDENSQNAHWRNRPKGKPFFSVFNLTITHEGKFHVKENEYLEATKDFTEAERHKPEDMVLPPYYPDTPVVRKDIAKFYDMVTAMDKQAGALLAELDADGLSSNTIVFFFTDHGTGLPRAKRWCYDSGLHIPLIIRWPGKLKPGTVDERLISLIDVPPTMMSITGLPKQSRFVGNAFLPDLEKPVREYAFAARDRMDETNDTIRAMRDSRYKYLRNFEPEKPYAQIIEYGEKTPTLKELRRLHADGKLTGSQLLFFRPTKPEEELYDTQTDPHEINDLAKSPEHQEVLARMRKALDDWQKETGDLGMIPEAELQERMRPGGKPLHAAVPTITVNNSKVEIKTATEGASIAYRFAGNESKRQRKWNLYTKPFAVDGATTVTAVACRAGYENSKEATVFVSSP